MMKLYSPIGEQDFMWFVTYDDGSFLTEIDYQTKEYSDYQSVKFDRVVEYGLLGIGVKLSVNLKERTFNIMGKPVKVEYLVDGEDVLTDLKNIFMTNPYKQAQAVTLMSANAKLQEFHDINSNILAYEFGIGLDGDGYKAQLICHLVRGERLYIQCSVLSKNKDVGGTARFTVNGFTKTDYAASLVKEQWSEVNWVFKE